MSTQGTEAKVILLGLDDALASELGSALVEVGQAVWTEPFRSPGQALETVEQVGAEMVFCGSERERYVALLEAIGRRKPGLPLVVVSRVPDVSQWLDAIEAGASDYCAAPFERTHIRWILESALRHPAAPASALYRTAG